jgi:hypothetical protein
MAQVFWVSMCNMSMLVNVRSGPYILGGNNNKFLKLLKKKINTKRGNACLYRRLQGGRFKLIRALTSFSDYLFQIFPKISSKYSTCKPEKNH